MEVWFPTVERQALHRADAASVAELNARIRAFVTGWNHRCHPFVGNEASTEILKNAKRPNTGQQ